MAKAASAAVAVSVEIPSLPIVAVEVATGPMYTFAQRAAKITHPNVSSAFVTPTDGLMAAVACGPSSKQLLINALTTTAAAQNIRNVINGSYAVARIAQEGVNPWVAVEIVGSQCFAAVTTSKGTLRFFSAGYSGKCAFSVTPGDEVVLLSNVKSRAPLRTLLNRFATPDDTMDMETRLEDLIEDHAASDLTAVALRIALRTTAKEFMQPPQQSFH